MRDQTSVDRLVAEAISVLGGLDVLVNNAGIGTPQSAGTATDEAALWGLSVNLVGPWRVPAAAMPALLESRGRAWSTWRRASRIYALARRVPRRLLDRAVSVRVARMARRGGFDGGGLMGEMFTRMVQR